MANKKAEILTMDGQVVSPITLATNVLLDDGRTAQDLLDSRDESMFSPTITTSSSISKVGQGDNVDFSENVIDGAYKSCVLKGKTLVNHNAEGNNRNEYACMPSLEGSNLTVNGTVESKVKSAILSGCTLVNLQPKAQRESWGVNLNGDIPLNNSYGGFDGVLPKLKPSTKYLIKFSKNISEKYNNTYFSQATVTIGKIVNDYRIVTTLDSLTANTTAIHIYPINNAFSTTGEMYDYLSDLHVMVIEYQEGMENWDIPYFEGMQSVKMPVLTTHSKNFYDNTTAYVEGVYKQNISNVLNIEPNTTYTFYANDKNWVEAILYNKTGVQVRKVGGTNATKLITFTTTDEEVKVKLTFLHGNNTVIQEVDFTGIQLEKSDTKSPYEPYKSNILTVNEPIELRGIGDVKDTLDCLTGEYVKAIYEYTFTGDEGWQIAGGKDGGYTYFSFSSSQLPIRYSYSIDINIPIMCDGLPVITYRDLDDKNQSVGINLSYFFRLNFSDCNSNDGATVEDLKAYLKANPTTVQYPISKSVKTVDLSDNVVHSYKDTTHYTCSSEDGSLIPTLTIEEGVRYKVIIKPSTKYSIVFNRTEVASGLTVDLGGATTSVTSSTLGKNIVQITTPSTLSHNYVIFKGLGNVIKDVQVIEGDVVGDEPYFEGMIDVEMPVVKNVGKNLFDGGISNHYWNAPFTNGAQDISMQRVDNCASTSRIRVRKGETYHLSGVNLIRNIVTFFKTKDSQEKPFHGLRANSFTSPYDGYIEWYISNDNINNPVKNVQIEAGSTTTPYEDYKTNILHTSEEVILRSLPNGVCDTLDLETGEYVQRIGEIVFDGSEDWTLQTQNGWQRYMLTVEDMVSIYDYTNSNRTYCDKLVYDVLDVKNSGSYLRVNNQIAIYNNEILNNINQFKQWLSQNPITLQYELATPITTTIDLKQHPFAYKDGYVVLTSSSEEVSLTPTIEYSLIANRLGQIQSNQKLVEKQQAQIDELESMVITNLVNTQYQQALNEIKLGVK